MSKERAKRITAILADVIEPLPTNAQPVEKEEHDRHVAAVTAAFELAGEFLNNVARIADALEEGNRLFAQAGNPNPPVIA